MNNLSRVYANQGRFDEAIVTATQAVGFFEMVGDPGRAAVLKKNLGKHYRKLGKKDLARQSFVEAIDLFAKAHDVSGEVATQADLRRA